MKPDLSGPISRKGEPTWTPNRDRHGVDHHRRSHDRHRFDRAGAGRGPRRCRGAAAIAQQPDEANTITRTLFVAMALIESTAIYALVVSLILLFANPFWAEVNG
jgi:F0F1-type ATP synthase membrane subunit c/vacuolar-type H+-ATPase subunit K